ncbi:MAG: hypothetical protein ACYDCF_10555 [Burkholderiales bacterium]
MAFADFGLVSESEAGENNGLEREDNGQKPVDRLGGEVRRLPQEPQTTRGNWRDQARKNPNRERLGFHYWWDGVYRIKLISIGFNYILMDDT